jgi:hypothetical protein
MELLFYSPIDSKDHGTWLSRLIDNLASDIKIEVYQTIDSLSERLRLPIGNQEILVLLIENKENLINMLSIKYLLRHIRIIIILPDSEVETISLAHRLRPRYLSYLNGNLIDLTALLTKMIAIKNHYNNNWH